MINIFVYGTLRPGQIRNDIVGGYAHKGIGTTPGKLYDLGAYPGARFRNQSKHLIVGDVYEVPEDLLQLLDRIEAEGYLYRRVKVNVTLRKSKEVIVCSSYEYMRDMQNPQLIESGDYLEAV